MFVGPPQPVEIHHRGIWYSGELIGWRHTSDGRAVARVRCRLDGLRHSAWMDLAHLRLPDPQHPPRKERYPAVLPRTVEDPDEDDATRPHSMLAVLGSARPARPAHVTAPPASPVARPWEDEHYFDEPAPLGRTEPSQQPRRNERLHQLDAYLTVV